MDSDYPFGISKPFLSRLIDWLIDYLTSIEQYVIYIYDEEITTNINPEVKSLGI
jgi:hypothetical protein